MVVSDSSELEGLVGSQNSNSSYRLQRELASYEPMNSHYAFSESSSGSNLYFLGPEKRMHPVEYSGLRMDSNLKLLPSYRSVEVSKRNYFQLRNVGSKTTHLDLAA